jgi:CTP synthase
MRLGAWKCVIKPDTLAAEIYGKSEISERHRHRYEFNSAYLSQLESNGLKASGINPDTGLVEIIEVSDHPFFIGVQYHPEYKSTVANPHPIFVSFVAAAVAHKNR